jgi:hypothetical protein
VLGTVLGCGTTAPTITHHQSGADGQRVRDFTGSIQGERLEELRPAIVRALR